MSNGDDGVSVTSIRWRQYTVPLLWLFQSGKGHLGAGNVLFWILQVLKERLLAPHNALVLVGRRVRVALHGARLAAKQPEQVGPQLVGASLENGTNK